MTGQTFYLDPAAHEQALEHLYGLKPVVPSDPSITDHMNTCEHDLPEGCCGKCSPDTYKAPPCKVCGDPVGDNPTAMFCSDECCDIFHKAKPRLKPVHAILIYGSTEHSGPYTIVKFQGTLARCQEELPGRAGEIILVNANQEVVIYESGEIVTLADLPEREAIYGHLTE